jgi:uncharacterized membrane-anchored protein
MQTKTQSMIESIANVAIGYFVAIGAQMAIFPAMGIRVELKENLVIGMFFTAVSIVRSYAVRRLFNKLHNKEES